MNEAPAAFASLQRLLRTPPPQAPGERCDYCAVPLSPEHGHLIDLQARRIMCSCRPCALTFEPEGAARGRYKAIPSRYAELAEFALDDAAWDALGIPIGLAFFFYNSAEGRTIALYPGPAGATESELDLSAWDEIAARNPQLATLAADVEAAIVLRRDGTTSCFIVPIDGAYTLVGLIRLGWKGFDGGPEAWDRIDAFFVDVRRRAGNARPAVPR
ncbi:MAG TPA: DUF5947 family protein [Candidatus Elarobacter sp.]